MNEEVLRSLLSDFDLTVDKLLKGEILLELKWIVELHDYRNAIEDVIYGREGEWLIED